MASGASIVKNTMKGKDYGKAVGNATERALTKIGAIIEGEAILRAPIKTGRLRGSLTFATKKDSDRTRAPAEQGDAVSTPGANYTLHVGTNVEYAAHMEYGTRKRGLFGISIGQLAAAQPFLRPALHDNRGKLLKGYKAEIHKGLKSGR